MRLGLRPLSIMDVVLFCTAFIVGGLLCAFAAIGLAAVLGW